MLSLGHVGHNYWHPIIATSLSQDNSSGFSPITPEEFGEHVIRDRRPFSLSRVSPDPSDSQLHVSTASLQFTHSFSTGFRSEDWESYGKRFILCSVTHFCVYFDVCFWLLSWWKIQTRPIIRFLTEAVRFIFCICWYLIESMMPCIWTRCPGPLAEKQAHSIKNQTMDMGYFLSLLDSSGGFAAKKQFLLFHLTTEASPVWRSSRVWHWICWRLFLNEWGEFTLKPIWTICSDVGAVWYMFLGFWLQDSTNLCNSPSVVLGESLATQSLLLSVH